MTRAEDGIAYLEFALMLPMLIAMFMGTIEVTRYILITQKTLKIAMTVANVTAQAQTISSADLGNIVDAAAQIMQPYTFGANGYVIISAVTQNGTESSTNPPVVSWQYSGGGAMNPVPGSRIGTKGNAAILPDNMPLNAGDNIIVAEVYYNYTPMMAANGILGSSTIYEVGLFKPRFGALSTCSGC